MADGSAKNAPLVASARQPRGLVLLNGTPTPYLSWDLSADTNQAAGTAQISLAAAAQPKGLQFSDLMTLPKIPVTVWAGFPHDPVNYTQSDLTKLFEGTVDTVEINVDGGTIELKCRDYVKTLLDNKVSKKHNNKKGSDIVAAIAAEYGFQTSITPTLALSGKQYEIDKVRRQDNQTEWDLISHICKEEDYVCYFVGNTLYFTPRPSLTQTPYVFNWNEPDANNPRVRGDFKNLTLTRDISLGGTVTVTVNSMNGRNKGGVHATIKKTTPGADSRTYVYNIAHLDSAQAKARAKVALDELTRHELKATLTGPAQVDLTLADVVKIDGDAYTQIFFIESIKRTMSMAKGFEWTVDLTNKREADAADTNDSTTESFVTAPAETDQVDDE